MKYKTHTILVILILAAGFSLQSSQNKIDTGLIEKQFQENIRKYTLKNGLRVILYRNTTSPTIACYLKIGVGAANEPFDIAGTAHLLEHLLFKGTEELGTLDYKKEKPLLEQIEKTGAKLDSVRRKIDDPVITETEKKELEKEEVSLRAQLEQLQKKAAPFILSEEDSRVYSLAGEVGYNAYTSSDVTNYQIKLPKNRLELWAELESHRFLNPVFREYYEERDVVLEERRMRYDSNPGNLLYELFNKTAFGYSPYGKPVIGFAHNITKLDIEDTKTFFKHNYIPSRMVIAIAGDIEFDNALAVIKKYFERLPANESPEFPPIGFENHPGEKRATLAMDHSPNMIVGWTKDNIKSPDNIYFDFLTNILTSGQNSKLIKRLVIDEKLAGSVKAYNGIPGDKLTNQFAIFVQPYRESDYEKIETIIYEEIEKLAEKGIEQKEIDKIAVENFKSMLDSINSNGGMADMLSYYELMLGDYNAILQYLAHLKKVKGSDLQKVIKETFIKNNSTVVSIRSPENN